MARARGTVRLSVGADFEWHFGDEAYTHLEAVVLSYNTAGLSTGADLCLKFGDGVIAHLERVACARGTVGLFMGRDFYLDFGDEISQVSGTSRPAPALS